jgi:putative hydroxymethylpyrimidine transport system permease protein
MIAVKRWAPPVVALALLVIVWQVYVDVFHVASYLVPSPSKIWTAFTGWSSALPVNIETTLYESVLGLMVGSLAGAVVAMTLWAFPLVRRILYPLLVASQTIPMVVLAPLLIIWFGIGLAPKVAVVALIAFFPVVVSMVQGLENTDIDLTDLLRTMGASRLQRMKLVLLPSSAPSFFAGMRIGASYAVAGAVIGEWVGANSGMGVLLTQAQRSFRVDRVFVATIIIAVVSILLFLLTDLLARLIMPWKSTKEI